MNLLKFKGLGFVWTHVKKHLVVVLSSLVSSCNSDGTES